MARCLRDISVTVPPFLVAWCARCRSHVNIFTKTQHQMKPDMDIARLIEAIRHRPLLYSKSDSMYYCHKKHKAKIWTDVCREVFLNWETYQPQHKVEYRHELQKRWKSLRTCFSREIALQKRERIQKEKDAQAVKRRKRYEHFEAMSFLLDPDVITDTDLTRDGDDDSSDPLETLKTESLYEESLNTAKDLSSIIEEANEVAGTHIPCYERNGTAPEVRVIEIVREPKKDEEDEDRQFLLSLVPSLRKLTAEQKFEARIRILKVIKEITFEEKDT